jgi:hypothetical protein
MLQIIGFLGCAYLFVKGLELLGLASRHAPEVPFSEGMSPEDRKSSDRESRGQDVTASAGWLAIIAAAGFAIWLLAQGNQMQDRLAPVQSYSDCIRDAQTAAEMLACNPG